MRYPLSAVAVLLAVASTTGCYVASDKHGDGDNVKIATPFGGMSVKTDDKDVLAGIGLPAYPGAILVKKDKINGHDNGSADVNMSFGSFQLRVKAVSYHTSDDPQKLLSFYRKALGRFGTVIQCDHNRPIGTPALTAEGLTCDDDDHGTSSLHVTGKGVQIDKPDHDAHLQLKAGSRKHQHIVELDPDGSGTKFGLIALDLPVDFHFGDKNDKGTDDDKDKDKGQE